MAFEENASTGGAPVTPPAPSTPADAVPRSAGPTSDMPTGDTLQAPAATVPAQPQLQLQPSAAAPTRSMFQSIVHGLIGGQLATAASHVLGAVAGPQRPDSYTTDESGKTSPVYNNPDRSRDRIARIAQAALQGLAAGSQVGPQKSAGAAWGAGVGAGAVGEMRETQAQDLLKRQQSKEQFEQEQKALTDKYIRAQHNITTYSLWQKGLQDQNEHDPERQKTEAIKNSAEDYISRNPATSMTTQVLSDTEARAMQAADKNNPASTTHVFFPYGMREVKDASGNTVYERDGVTPKKEGQVLVIGGGSKDGKMPLPQTFVDDLKKYGAMAGIGRVDDVKAGDEWNLDRFLTAGSRMNPIKEQEIDGWKEKKLGENSVRVGNEWVQENTFTHERRPYGATPQETEKINAQIDKDNAEAAKFRGEAAKARSDAANKGDKPIYAYNTQSKQLEQTTRAEMNSQPGRYTNPVDVKESDIRKDQDLARQLGDAQMNVSRYRAASNRLDQMGESDRSRMAALIGDDKFKAEFMGAQLPVDWMNKMYSSEQWPKLSPEAQDAVIGYIGARGAVIAYQKAVSGSGRSNKEQLELELQNIPNPLLPKDVREKQFDRFQANIDQTGAGLPKMVGVDRPQEIRQRIEAEETKKSGATHVYDPGSGQPIPVGKTPVKNYKGQVLGYFLSGDSGEWVRFSKQ